MAAYAALVSLSHTLRQILHPPPLNNIIIDREQIEFLQGKVNFFIDFLENSPRRGSDEIEDLETKIADAAYTTEDLIESSVMMQIRATGGENISTVGIQTAVIEKFLSIEKELVKMRDEQGVGDLQPKTSESADSSRPFPGGKITMVGFDDLLIEVISELTTDESNCRIIPIVGMGGIGKTTLATAVYNHSYIVEYFYIRAWVTISQEYTVGELLLRLLYEINKVIPEKQDKTDDELGELLHKVLFDRRYLIVLDDMWNIRALEELKRYFPDNKNGSRILVTTRVSNLTVDFESCSAYKIDFLNEGQSWDLLCQKVFREDEKCPVELEEIGKDIVRRCNGLPLALVVIGGILAKTERRREHWESIAGDITSALNYGNDEQLMNILSLSYIHLPVYLKPCFLYLAVFPEDSEIRVSMIVRLWVAEGLIKTTQAKCLEEVANEYLEDLFSRNLILAHKRGSSGKVKRCKIHDMLRDLCIIQAEKEKFVYIAKFDDPNISPNIETNRRLHISSPIILVATAIEALKSAEFCRSWLSHFQLSGSDWCLPEGSLEDKVNEIIHGFELLKVVHVNDRENHIDLLKLSNLRCVLARSVSSSSMSLCWNLQTLVVDELDITLPAEVWQMPQLRHLIVSRITLPDPPCDQNVIVLENLQTLITIRNFKCTEQVLERIPNLKKLRLLYSESSATSEQVGNYCLHNLVSFKKLESLGIYCAGRSWTSIAFPISLKKLSLYYSMIPWEDLSIVGSLPNLEVLKLFTLATVGEEWNPIEGEFCRLKFLLIWGCQLKIWGADCDHFPCLERLLLAGVENLKEIPMSFAEIISFQEIELYRVGNSVLTSAREISGERELLGYEPLQVRRYNGWEW